MSIEEEKRHCIAMQTFFLHFTPLLPYPYHQTLIL